MAPGTVAVPPLSAVQISSPLLRRIQSIPLTVDSFDNRATLPEPWRGKRDAELSSASGIAGCVFVHAKGFIGGNHTKDGALAMARTALALLGK